MVSTGIVGAVAAYRGAACLVKEGGKNIIANDYDYAMAA